jgi:hypothetical protein
VTGSHQRKAFNAIRDCLTAALGGHVQYVEQCDQCGHRVISYNSCRNRHCPKCQGAARAKWLADRESEVLLVPYFHVVFTLPQKIGGLALQNPNEIYTILFRAASETLLTIAADPRHLGAAIGFLSILPPGGRSSIYTRIFIASFRAAALVLMAFGGSAVQRSHSFSR